jgi:hypothetical protein
MALTRATSWSLSPPPRKYREQLSHTGAVAPCRLRDAPTKTQQKRHYSPWDMASQAMRLVAPLLGE